MPVAKGTPRALAGLKPTGKRILPASAAPFLCFTSPGDGEPWYPGKMNNALAFTREVPGNPDDLVSKVEGAFSAIGFGSLSRIDLDQKFSDKLGKKIPRTIILGVCNPAIAYEAYRQTTDVALLIPCNIVLRETGPNRTMIEVMRPSQMLAILPEIKPDPRLEQAEKMLREALAAL